MPIINLTAEQIVNPTRLTLAVIEGVMLWPDDETMRKNAFAAALNQDVPEVIRSGVLSIESMDADLLADLLKASADATPLRDIHETAKPRLYEGTLIGDFVCEMLDPPAGVAPARTLKEAQRRALGRLGGKHGRNFDLRRLNNEYWPRYRPAAHLWTAYVARSRRARPADPEPFPCSVASLPEFLGVSELMVREGTRRKLGQGGALLDPATAWRPTPAVIELLPGIAFE